MRGEFGSSEEHEIGADASVVRVHSQGPIEIRDVHAAIMRFDGERGVNTADVGSGVVVIDLPAGCLWRRDYVVDAWIVAEPRSPRGNRGVDGPDRNRIGRGLNVDSRLIKPPN